MPTYDLSTYLAVSTRAIVGSNTCNRGNSCVLCIHIALIVLYVAYSHTSVWLINQPCTKICIVLGK